MPARLLMIGIDGGSHPIVERMIAAGRMPNLEKLSASGARGPLRATFPPHTAPGWVSMFTGVNPGEHGVYQFWNTQDPQYGAPICGADDFAREPVWHSLERHGWRVGMLNVPMTHPPRPLRGGFMVSWPLVRTLRYSEPAELVGQLARAGVHFQSDLMTMYRDQQDYLPQVQSFIRGRTQSVHWLLEHKPVDALFVVYTELDRVSHYYWGDREEPSEAVLQCYETMDCAIGELVASVPDDCLIAVASDHGFGVCTANVYVHTALEQAGLLRTRLVPMAEPAQSHASDYEEGGASWFRSSRSYRKEIDWAGTRVFMPTPGCFGLNLNLEGRQRGGIVRECDRAALVEEVRAVLREIGDAEGPFFEVVPAAEVYRGRRLDQAPDLVLLPRRWDLMPHPGLEDVLIGASTQAGVHRMEGIVCLRGPGVSQGGLVDARIEDVAPTLLALLGLPIQESLDGRALFGSQRVREPRIPWNEDRVVVELTPEDRREADRRLAALGYL